MIKENIKLLLRLIAVMLIYLLGSFPIMDIIQWQLLSGKRSIIVEICYCVLDIICASALFCMGYKNNKLKNCVAVIIFSFLTLGISLRMKDIYSAYMAFFGFSMIVGTIANVVRNSQK